MAPIQRTSTTAALRTTLALLLLLLAPPGAAQPLVVPGATIRTLAGGGSQPGAANGSTPAAGVWSFTDTNSAYGVAVDGDRGAVFLTDRGGHSVKRLSLADCTLAELAGVHGSPGFDGDDARPATAARLNAPLDLAVLPGGDVLIVDAVNARLRRVAGGGGNLTTAGGGGNATGDGVPATSADMASLRAVAASPADGAVYLAFTTSCRIRRIDPVTWRVATVVGGGPCLGVNAGTVWDARTGVVGPGTSVSLGTATLSLAWDAATGSLLFVEATNHTISALRGGVVRHVAGTGRAGLPGSPAWGGGEGAAANVTALAYPVAITVVPSTGVLLVAERDAGCVRAVDPATGRIAPFVGRCDGVVDGWGGDGGAPANATLGRPVALAAGSALGVPWVVLADRPSAGSGLPNRLRAVAPPLSPSPTGTPSPTRTPTGSGSTTATPTGTPPPTRSPSGTPSASPTGSPTGSSTGSPSGTPPPTPSGTPTPTPSGTGSPTSTATGSPTGSPTTTGSRSDTATATPTSSGTPPATPPATSSLTVTPTASPPPTASASAPPSATAQPSASGTPSSTLSGSASGSGTPSPPASSTPSRTASPSLAASPTASPSIPPTPTGTASLSLPSPSRSASPPASTSGTGTPRPRSGSAPPPSPSGSAPATPTPSRSPIPLTCGGDEYPWLVFTRPALVAGGGGAPGASAWVRAPPGWWAASCVAPSAGGGGGGLLPSDVGQPGSPPLPLGALCGGACAPPPDGGAGVYPPDAPPPDYVLRWGPPGYVCARNASAPSGASWQPVPPAVLLAAAAAGAGGSSGGGVGADYLPPPAAAARTLCLDRKSVV